MYQLANLKEETSYMLAVLRRVATGSGRSCRGGARKVAAAAAASSTRSLYQVSRGTTTPLCVKNNLRTPAVSASATNASHRSNISLHRRFTVLGPISAVVPTSYISRSSFPRSRVTGELGDSSRNASPFEPAYNCRVAPSIRLFADEVAEDAGASAYIARADHRAQRFQLPEALGNGETMTYSEQERWSGGSGTAGRSSTRGWLWTAAAIAAMTAATTSTVAANPIRPPEGANAVSYKPDSVAPPGTTPTLVGGGGCDCGCGGTTSSRCQMIRGGGDEGDDIGENQVSTAAGAGGGKSSAPVPLEKKSLWRPSSSDAQTRYGAWVGAGASGGSGTGSGSSGETRAVLVEEEGIDLEGSVSALREGEALEGGAAVGMQEDENPWTGKAVPLAGRPLFTSVTSTKGHRPHMEDEFFMSSDGSFSAVYDGHGGANVSKYLRRNFYRHFMENLPSEGHDAYDLATVEQALKAAYEAADTFVTTQTPYRNEGSCAVSVTVHCDRQGKASLISCNVGDSRAVLSRGGKAVDLTEDHKPNAPGELERIYRHDGMVTWEGFECSQGLKIEGTGVYRINGNLAVARAIGDVDYRPWVSGEAEIRTIEINRETDQFVILASDGLWDVMTSEEAVDFVHSIMGGALGASGEGGEGLASNEAGSGDGSGEMTLVNWAQSYAEDRGMIRAATMLRKKKMAHYLTAEAMRRGSMDNTTVAVVWLQ